MGVINILLPYVLLIVGFFILIQGANFFVEGSKAVAKALKIPDIIVGLTIVAMGTSAPELAVSISAALGGSSDIAIGNVVGSNILNILVILGISAVIVPLTVDKSLFKRDFPVLLLTAIMLPIMTVVGGKKIGRISAIIMIAIFILYLVIAVKSALDFRKNDTSEQQGEDTAKMPIFKVLLYIIGGAVGIIWGADISVNSATSIAHQWNISEAIIGLTIVALGTSLPELVTSVVAAKKGSSDMALGNIVGSNIFNVLFILGTTALIKPFTVTVASLIDQIILLAVTIILFIASFTKSKISRIEGGVFLLLYVAYATYIFIRG